jgi:hypothetical protein
MCRDIPDMRVGTSWTPLDTARKHPAYGWFAGALSPQRQAMLRVRSAGRHRREAEHL